MADDRLRPPYLVASGLTLRYPGAEARAVEDVSFSARRGEVVTLLGPSGCGKTTALRLVAGLETPDAGAVEVEGRDITAEPAERRNMGFVFQSYALFPHLSVGENVAFGLRVRRTGREEIRSAVAESLELVGLGGFDARRVDQLSGGQQQRVALARALAIRPEVLLMDEPLSNLDTALREQTREALREVLSKLQVTTLFVTHDQAEAFAFSDQVVLMRAGRVVEMGAPERLYRAPESAFAAEFIGAANLIAARVAQPASDVTIGAERIEVRAWSEAARSANAGDRVLVVARPEALRLVGERSANALPGRVVDRLFLGAAYRLTVVLDESGAALRVHTSDAHPDGAVWVVLPPDALRVLPEAP